MYNPFNLLMTMSQYPEIFYAVILLMLMSFLLGVVLTVSVGDLCRK